MRGRSLDDRFLLMATGSVAWFALLAVTSSAGCQSFAASEEAPTPPSLDDAGADATNDDAGADDAGADGEAPPEGMSCTAARAPTRVPSNDDVTTIYRSATRAFPFGITSDARNLYWLEQPAGGGAPTPVPYNGGGIARLLRLEKSSTADAQVLVEALSQATSLAIDGDALYVPTWGSAGSTEQATLLRISATCAPPCAGEEVASFPARIREVVRVAPKLLFARAQNGTVFRIDLSATKAMVTESENMPSDPPGMAVTRDAVFVAAGESKPNVYRFDDAGARRTLSATEGARNIATDCTSLWFSRGRSVVETDFSLVDLGASRPGPLADRNHNVYDMAADAAYVYFAYPDAGGLFAMSTDASDTKTYPIYSGNVHALHVDDDGVYWGEHADINTKLSDGTFSTGRIFMMPK